MAIIKKFASYQNLTNFQVFEIDKNPTSDYFRITELEPTLTGGKNGFLIEGSEYLKETTEIKIEILDVEGNPIYYEPGDGIPEYYEGTSKLVSIHVYEDTPIGVGRITILGELKNYISQDGSILPIPEEWKGIYNVKWETEFRVDKTLPNETRVRFYKRPLVNITELVKPIFSKTIPSVTKTGFVHGISEIPILGTDIRNWRAGTTYKLQLTSGSWDRDVDENTITITSPNHTAKIIEVLNDTEVLVDIPYTSDNLVSNFTSGSYSITYSDFQNEIVGETSLTGSFAKIDITQLKTFVGDVARVKVFRKSRNAVGDFQFVQESKLESSELLRDVTTSNNTELSYGRFDESNLSTYWVSSSNDHTLSIDSSVLSQAVKFDYNTSVGGVQQLITSESFSISNDVEYTLNFRTLLSGSVSTSNKSIRAFFSSSEFTQDFITISGSAIYTTRENISKNIISENTGNAKLVFEVQGDDWYISNVSLKNAQETSFSPDEFTLIQDIPRKTASETFDFRFEFYDINNNFIPVEVTAVGVFDGGNDFPTSGKLLTFESDRNAFRFSSGSVQNPTNQQIQLKVTQNNLTGSITFESSAFDVDGNYLSPSDYTQYPGKLTSVNSAGAIITINNFTGSRTDGLDTPFVGSVVYTASLENLQEFETVYRLEDGDNAPQLIVTSNTNQFIYEPTTLSPKPNGQSITVRAQRKNLASLITPLTINSGSNRPALTYVDTVGGVDTYTISATAFSQSFASNNFDEVTYSFTGSDVFGNSQTDEITLSKVINFDAVSLVLSNESTSFPAKSTGEVIGNFNASSGSVQMFIGGTQITHDDYDSDSARNRNTFDIKTITESNVTASSTSPTNEFYSITGFDTNKDSGSLTLNIEYLAGDNSTSQSFQKIVSYTKSKKAVPVVLTKTSPSSQTINSSSVGFETVQDVEVIVQEGGTEYTYDSSLSGGGDSNIRKFDIVSVHSGSDNGDGTITPTAGTYSSYNGTIGSASLNYVDSEGTYVTNKLVRFDVSVSKTGIDGQDGFSTKLTNDSHVFKASSVGTITSNLSDGAFETRMFKGSTQFTYEDNGAPYSTNTYRVNASSSSIELSQSTVSNQRKFTPTSVSGDSGSADITIIDNNTGIGFEHIYTFTKATAGSPVVVASLDPQTQTVDSNSDFSSVTAPSTITLTVNEGGTDYGYDSSGAIANEKFRVTAVTGGTFNTSTGIITPTTPSDASGTSGVVTYSYRNSEGTEFTGKTIKFSVGVSTQGDNGNPPLSPTSLRVSDSLDTTPFDGSPGTISTPTISNTHYGIWNSSGTAIGPNVSFNNIGYLGLGESLTSDNNFSTDMKVYCQRTLEIGDIIVLYQDADNYGNYTLAAKTDADGSGDTVLQLTFVSSAGSLTGQSLNYIGFGRELVGPGVVYRGEYDSGTTYYYSETRRDIVEYSGTYYLASNPSDSGTSNWGTPGSSTDWETFGAEFSSVATDILFAQDVYANRTVNIGSDGSNPVIALNSDHANSNANPYISIGAASYEGAGIFLGYDSGTAKASLVNSGGTRYLKWDGSGLEIKGSITVTGGDAATQTQAQGYANTAESNAQSYADNVGENALLTGSIDSFELSLTSNMEIDGRKLRKIANDNVWNGEVRSGIAFTDGAVVSFKVENTASGRRFMMGLNSDPTTDTSHTSIDYHWYINGAVAIERAGSGNASGAANVTVTDGDYFTVVYDGTRILWYHNSTLTNSISTNAGQRFFLDSSFYDTTTLPICTWFTFGPDSPKNDSSKTDGEVGGWTITSTEIQGGTVSGGGNAAFTTTGMRLGSTGYISAPQFYIDASGNAKFKGSLEAASGTFSGALKVGSIETSASDVVDGASAGSTAAQPGDDISGFNNDSGYQDNDADKTGGSVGGWAITSLAIKGGSPTSGGDGVFTNTGIIFGIDGSNDAYISAKNFYIDTDGNAKFSGTVSGSSIQGGTMTIGDNFSVDNDGNMTAQDATISGSFSIDGGTLGSWIVESPSVGGRLRNEYDVSAPGTGSLVFEPSIPEIQGYKIDGNDVDKKISIHPENTWTSAAGGNQGSSIENNNGSTGGTWSLPSNKTSSNSTSTVQYNSTDQDLAGVIDGVGTATTFTIPQSGTFEITGLANLSSITMSTPSSITGNVTTGYPSYNGTSTYQTHVPLVVAKGHYFTVDLIFKNTSTNVETTVNVQTIIARGAKTQNGYQWNGSSWQSYTNSSSSSPASTSFASVSKTVTLSAGSYNAFYRIRNGAASGYVQQPVQSTGMYGSIPPVYSTTTNSVTSVGYNSLNFTLVIPSNLIEISSKGIQILNDTTNFIQFLRTDTVSGTPEVISVKGGKMKMYHKDYSAGYGLTSMLDVDGHGSFRGLTVSSQYSGTNTNQLGFNSDVTPRYTNYLDIGNATYLWDNIYATSGTVNTSDRNEKENISGSILGLDFVNNLRPVKFNFISGSRTHYGLISQEVSESLASSSVHTDDFGGFIRTDLYNSGSEELVPDYIIKKNEDELGSIDNWTYSGESKYALRYTEFIAPMIKAIQELSTKVNELEAQISGSI